MFQSIFLWISLLNLGPNSIEWRVQSVSIHLPLDQPLEYRAIDIPSDKPPEFQSIFLWISLLNAGIARTAAAGELVSIHLPLDQPLESSMTAVLMHQRARFNPSSSGSAS
eukprot:TRINITY_DN1463_c0_g1_i1.p1 TRINITY_DN1463_c0_g1~~TRINITY_DN1463_c0_g1_i1.p1  ORF type:complete len:110 (-),score=8.93 TRINITY_DN1463_c0_g1_i1:438-767(-)